MCGIAGLLTSQVRSNDSLADICARMTNTLRHRGPDDFGTWSEDSIALGHRRLSILDLSPEGHQPMLSASKRYVIVFNGEVYNYRQVRKELESQGEAPSFRGGSDTEVMLAAVSAWGVRRAVEKFVGMFAFALWDRQDRVLYLVRDRIGKKPLYYGWVEKDFVFGSELKALKAHPDFCNEINRDALALYFRHNYVPGPFSIYKNVFKLMPGHILQINSEEARHNGAPISTEAYWSAKEVWVNGSKSPWQGTQEEAVVALEELLRDSVKLRMISDVPLGVFLSGGIDSSTVAALMQSITSRPVKTFSMGFEEAAYNEAHHAALVAKHLGTDHTEMYVTEEDARKVIPDLANIYDEPFADSSQIPTCLVSNLARRHVTVALSGDGGDELFLGYPRYPVAVSVQKTIQRIPSPLRRVGHQAALLLPDFALDFLGYLSLPFLAAMGFHGRYGENLRKHLHLLGSRSFTDTYQHAMSYVTSSDHPVIGGRNVDTEFSHAIRLEGKLNHYELMSYLDMFYYLPDDILVKVDRASMAVGLEARAPLLDHRVVEFASRLPVAWKISNGKSKHVLRQVLYRFVPEKLIDRQKMGFGIPLPEWLRGPLRSWAEDLLAADSIEHDGYLDATYVRGIWKAFLSGRTPVSHHLWGFLIFQAWLRSQ